MQTGVRYVETHHIGSGCQNEGFDQRFPRADPAVAGAVAERLVARAQCDGALLDYEDL